MSAVDPAPPRRSTFVPGEPGLWLFLFADLMMFAVLFGCVIVLRADQPEVFETSQATLSQALGTVSTVLLLTGSLFAARAVRAFRTAVGNADRLLLLAFACGVGFLVVKVFDWGGKFADGYGPSTNEFYGLYFMLTGIHLAHVLIGLGVVGGMRRSLKRGTATPALIEGGACYWHLVDLLWVVLFPLLFLI